MANDWVNAPAGWPLSLLTFTLRTTPPVNGHFCLTRDQTGQHFSIEIKWHKERRANREHNWRHPVLWKVCVINFFKLGHWEGTRRARRGQEVILVSWRGILLQLYTCRLILPFTAVTFLHSGWVGGLRASTEGTGIFVTNTLVVACSLNATPLTDWLHLCLK